MGYVAAPSCNGADKECCSESHRLHSLARRSERFGHIDPVPSASCFSLRSHLSVIKICRSLIPLHRRYNTIDSTKIFPAPISVRFRDHRRGHTMMVSKSILISGIALSAGVRAGGSSESEGWASSTSSGCSTEVITETLPPSTVSIPYTVTSTVDVYKTITITVTSISISVVTSTATQYSEKDFTSTVSFTTKVNQPTTIVSSFTTTVEQATTLTLTDSFTVTSTPLTGIVLCPSRTINPTYTAPAPFPDDYTWGCPPGSVCTPPKVNCNFEQNPPADTYYCSPDECKAVGALPDLLALEASAGTTCGPFPTIATEPFNFNPSLFGLGFTIFECGGDWAESCSGGATTTTTTELETVTLNPVTITEKDYETITVAPASPSKTWSSESSTSAWARLGKRQQAILPAVCFQFCDNCLEIACNDGKPANCPGNSPFSVAYSDCEACISSNRGAGPTIADQVLPSLSQFVTYCKNHPGAGKKRRDQPQTTLVMASPTSESVTIETPPPTTARASLARSWPRHAIN